MKLGTFETVIAWVLFALMLALAAEVHVNVRNGGGGWMAQSVTHSMLAVSGFYVVTFAKRVWRMLAACAQ